MSYLTQREHTLFVLRVTGVLLHSLSVQMVFILRVPERARRILVQMGSACWRNQHENRHSSPDQVLIVNKL